MHLPCGSDTAGVQAALLSLFDPSALHCKYGQTQFGVLANL